MDNDDMLISQEKVMEIPLPGPALDKETVNLDQINRIGFDLFSRNREYIREHIPGNWFAVVEPTSGKLIASLSQNELYRYTTEKYPNKVFFVIGLIERALNANA